MDSLDALDLSNSSERLAVTPPPSVSFRTKSAREKQPAVQLDPASPESERILEFASAPESQSEPIALSNVSDHSMSEFYQLRNGLSLSTLMWTGIILGPVWFFYDWNVALNYLLGAMAGLMYLRLLARNVERLGRNNQVGKSQMAVFIGVIIIATQVDGLHVLPVFLGFLTYKVAILIYAFRTAVFN